MDELFNEGRVRNYAIRRTKRNSMSDNIIEFPQLVYYMLCVKCNCCQFLQVFNGPAICSRCDAEQPWSHGEINDKDVIICD